MGLERGPWTQPALESTGYGVVAGKGTPIPTPDTQPHFRQASRKHTFTRTLQRWPWQSQFKGPFARRTPSSSLGNVAPKAGGEGTVKKDQGC